MLQVILFIVTNDTPQQQTMNCLVKGNAVSELSCLYISLQTIVQRYYILLIVLNYYVCFCIMYIMIITMYVLVACIS